MSLKIEYLDESTGLSLYALIFDASGRAYNTQSNIFDSYTDASINNFTVNLSEGVNRKKYYSSTINNVSGFSTGSYDVEVYNKMGVSGDKSVDLLKGLGTLYWNGVTQIDEVSTPRLSNVNYLGEIRLGEELIFTTYAFDRFGNLVDADSVPSYNVYYSGSSIATGVMTRVSSGFYYGSLVVTSGTYSNDKNYNIGINTYIQGTNIAANGNFMVREDSNESNIDIIDDLGYVVCSVLSSSSTSGFITNLSSTIDGHHNGSIARVRTGTLKGQARIIYDYNGTTKQILTNLPFSNTLASGTEIVIYPIGGELNVT